MNVTHATAPVKPAAFVVLFDGTKPRQPGPFGRGVFERYEGAQWASDGEFRQHRLDSTLSPAEYRDMQAMQASSASARRELFMDSQDAELAEMGITAERLESMARDAMELAAYCG